MKTKEQIRTEIGRLLYELQVFQAQENEYMMTKIENKISELRKFMDELK